jgi:AcrR family transcriptional regulator
VTSTVGPPSLRIPFTISHATVNTVHSQDADIRLQPLWGVAQPPGRGPRPRFTAQDVAMATVRVADAGGLTALTMSATAADLRLATTALYRYVDSKDMLLELAVDTAVGPPPELTGEDWHDRAGKWARALWNRYSVHPWLAEVRVAGMPRLPHRLGWIEALLRELDGGSVGDPMNTALLLDTIARSFRPATAAPDASSAPAPWLVEAISKRYPRLSRELGRDWRHAEDEFDAAVRTVLAGAERRSGSPPSH